MLWVLKVQKKSLLNPLLQILKEKKGIMVQGELMSWQVSVCDSYLCFCGSVPKIPFALLPSSQLRCELSSLQFSLTTSGKINPSYIPTVLHVYFYSCTCHIVLQLFSFLSSFRARP